MDQEKLKQCPKCQTWFSAGELIEDGEIEPIGMAVGPGKPHVHYYYFNHNAPDCETTFVVPCRAFEPFMTETLTEKDLALSTECGMHCTRMGDLENCDRECRWAAHRRFLLKMLKKKRDQIERS